MLLLPSPEYENYTPIDHVCNFPSVNETIFCSQCKHVGVPPKGGPPIVADELILDGGVRNPVEYNSDMKAKVNHLWKYLREKNYLLAFIFYSKK